MIKAVNESSSSSFAAGGLNAIKGKLTPHYPAATADEGLSLKVRCTADSLLPPSPGTWDVAWPVLEVQVSVGK